MSKSGHLGLGSLEKWDIATTSKFLKLYRHHRCLWEITNPNYKDKNHRKAALEEISKEMNLPSFDTRYVVLKIRALRSTYIYERRKVRQRMKSGEKLQTHLGWYHLADSFLRKFVVEKTYTGDTEDQNKDLPLPVVLADGTYKYKTIVLEKDELENSATAGDSNNETAATAQIEFYTTDIKSRNSTEIEFEEEENDNVVESFMENKDDNMEVIIDEELTNVKTFRNRKRAKQNYKISVTPSVIPTTTTTTTTIHAAPDEQQHTTIISNSTDQATSTNTTATIEAKHENLSFDVVQPTVTTTATTNCNDNNDDEFDAFAKSVAMQMRRIPKEDAYSLQVQFQLLLSQAKLRALGKNTSIVLTDSQNLLNFSK